MALTLRKRLIALLNTLNCNGQPAFSSSYLIGTGTGLQVFTSWAASWSSQQTMMKYFMTSSAQAEAHLSTYDIDFGAVADGLSAQWYARMPDVGLLPVIAFAIVPGTSPQMIIIFWKLK
jgi:hypothetical protein